MCGLSRVKKLTELRAVRLPQRTIISCCSLLFIAVPDENVAHPKHGTQVLQGEMRSALLDGDSHNYDMERGYTRHAINESGDHGILIKLGTQAIINHIKMLLWDRDLR